MESDQKHLTALTNISLKSILSETSPSELSSSKSSSSSESSLSKSSFSETSSSESSSSELSSSEISSFESSDSDIDEIVNMIKHQRIRKQIRKRQRGVLEEKCILSIRKIFSD